MQIFTFKNRVENDSLFIEFIRNDSNRSKQKIVIFKKKQKSIFDKEIKTELCFFADHDVKLTKIGSTVK